MKEPGTTPYQGIPLSKEQIPLVRGDYFLFLPDKATGKQIGEVIEHRGVNMRMVERHKCGAEEFVVLGTVDNPV